MHSLVGVVAASSWTMLDAGELSPHSSTAQTLELDSIIVTTLMMWGSLAQVCCGANIFHSFDMPELSAYDLRNNLRRLI